MALLAKSEEIRTSTGLQSKKKRKYTASLYLITIEMRGEKRMGRETNRRRRENV
jgi:hypothetical protein